MSGIMVEVEKAYPIKPEIISGLCKLIYNLTGEDGAEFEMEEGMRLIKGLSRLGKNARFDLICHMAGCTEEECAALLSDY